MKTKKLIALLVVAIMLFVSVASLAACVTPDDPADHVCGHKCTVEGCGKCLDADCDDPVCAEKCPGHTTPDPDHECKHVCPTCQKCTDASCTDAACADKCPGHTVEPEYECQNKCEVCGGCLTVDCEHDACERKCEVNGEHGEIVEANVTFNAGTHGEIVGEATAVTVNGKLASLPTVTTDSEHCDFLGWFTAATEGEKVDTEYFFDVTEETKEVTVYAQYKHEFVITLNVEADLGTIVGEVSSFVTVDGKITETLPAVTSKKANYDFFGWYTQQNGAGEEVIEEETVFTADTDIYALVGRKTGIWANGETYNALVRNTGAGSTGGLVAEYWFGGSKKTFTKDDVLSVYMNGKQVSFYIASSSSGIKVTSTTSKVNSVTVTVTGEFEVYLKDYSSSAQPNNWVCEFGGPTETEGPVDGIPSEWQDCAPAAITFTNGTVTIYLKNSGVSVTESDMNKYCIYTYNNEAFGNWAGSTTKGLFQSTMSATVACPSGWIFRWGSSYSTQTANIINVFAVGNTYLVDLQGSGASPTITPVNVG